MINELLLLSDNFPSVRKVTNFAEILKKAMEEHVEKVKEANEKRAESNRDRKLRYNGKTKRREWVQETEEAKRIRLENTTEADRVKRRKCCVLLGYSGVNYNGMQRNPDVATIEEELLKTMLKHRWVNEMGFQLPQQAFFQRAARTDKGVSAARQVVSLKLRKKVFKIV